MSSKFLTGAASLIAAAALAALPVSAEASIEVVSSGSNSLCVTPTPGFEPEIGGNPNYAPLTTPSSVPGEPFPDTGSHCATGFPTNAIPLKDGGPGKAAWPYSGKLAPSAEWVSYNAEGWDFSNVSPANTGIATPSYYIYDETFRLCKTEAEVAKAKLSGTMFADNRAGAFLNGYPIGSQTKNNVIENFDGPPAGGFPFAAGPADFKSFGANTLQFVVMDQSPPFTGLDFKAKVTWKCSKAKGGKG